MAASSRRGGIRGRLTPPAGAAGRRILVVGAAGVLLTAPVSVQQVIPVGPLLGCALTLVGVGLAVRCCRWRWNPSTGIAWAALVACVVFAAATLAEGAGQMVTALRATEAQLVCADDVSPGVVIGGQEILHGSNPYTSYNVLSAELALGCPSFHVSAVRSGRFASRNADPSAIELQAVARAAINARASSEILLGFSYPAGTALIGIADAHGVVLLNLLFLLGAGALLVGRSLPALRGSVTLALLAQTGVLVLIGTAHPDGIVAALLVVACAWRGPLVGGVALGMACAIKQTAWFVAPALLLLAFRRGRQAGLRQATTTVLIFAGVNAPFALANPALWFDQVVRAPLSAPYFAIGEGPVAFFTSTNRLTIVLAAFSVIAALTVVGGWLLAALGRGGWAGAGVVVSSMALWDGARSLGNYIGLLGLIAVSMCVRNVMPLWTGSASVAPGQRRLLPNRAP